LKFAVNITREPNRLTNRHRSSRSEPFFLVSSFASGLPPGVTLRLCGVNFWRVTPGLNQG